VRRRGSATGQATVVAYAVPSRDGRTRVAITVSKAVGKAVVRNLVRRRIRGALDGFPPVGTGVRLLIVAKPASATVPYERLAGDVRAALGRIAHA